VNDPDRLARGVGPLGALALGLWLLVVGLGLRSWLATDVGVVRALPFVAAGGVALVVLVGVWGLSAAARRAATRVEAEG
jgi:hypothetical protein